MRFAVLADIHANRQALEACLRDVAGQGIDQVIYLGDMIGYGADPNWVLDEVRRQIAKGQAQALLGNHEEAAITDKRARMNSIAEAAIAWQRERLSTEECAFIAALPFSIEASGVCFVHAEPAMPSRWTYVTDRETAQDSLARSSHALSICGHVHRPMLYGVMASGKLIAFRPPRTSPSPYCRRAVGLQSWGPSVNRVMETRPPATAFWIRPRPNVPGGVCLTTWKLPQLPYVRRACQKSWQRACCGVNENVRCDAQYR